MDRYRRFGRVANNSYEAQERQYVDRRRSTTEPQAFFNFLPQLGFNLGELRIVKVGSGKRRDGGRQWERGRERERERKPETKEVSPGR